METRKDLTDRLTAAGMPGTAVNLIARATAHGRATYRARTALEAAWAFSFDGDFPVLRELRREEGLELALLAILDATGTGGELGTGAGGATPRHPAFQGCGSGRKQAGDGGAWSAAVDQVVLVRWEGRGWPSYGDLRIRPDMSDPDLPSVSLTDGCGEPVEIVATGADTEEREWYRALCRRAILALSCEDGIPAYLQDAVIRARDDSVTAGHSAPLATLEGDPRDWARLLDALTTTEEGDSK